MSDWCVPCSDGESQEDDFIPPPEVIIDLYRKLDKGEELKFDTKIYPRHEPESEVQKESPEKEEIQKTPERLSPEEKTEFDFDTQPDDNIKRFTPRRTPSKPQTKKVGRMENVFTNIFKYQKIEEDQKAQNN